MPNYFLLEKNKITDIGFFICDMEADQYVIETYQPAKKYKIIDKDYFDYRITNQKEQQNITDVFF